MSESLEYGHVLINGNKASENEIANLLGLISTKLTKFHTAIEKMSDIAVRHKYLDIFWYRGKPMADALGRNWQPSEKIHAKADSAFRTPEPPPPYRSKETFEEYRAQFDYSNGNL